MRKFPLHLIHLLLACWALLAVGAVQASAQPKAESQAPSAGQDATDRQILVMLKMAPPHFRPNSSYGGSYGDAMSSAARKRVARSIARKNGFQLVESWPMPLLGVDCYVMLLPDGVSIDAAIEKVSRNPMVAWSEPMGLYRSFGSPDAPNDPLYRVAPVAKFWRLSELHRVATGRGVSVAIVDSRIDVDHPDLKGQFIVNSDFVPNRRGPPERHGTEVAGIIGAREGNGVGMIGVAPNARLMALRACWQTADAAAAPTLCDSLSLARAMLFAVEHGAQIINLSLSGPPSALLQKLVAIALQRHASVVAAFDPKQRDGGFPASLPGVIAVADESLPSVPSGLYVAPGRDVPTTQPGGKWYLVNGSSYAAAHVSGLIALVRERSGGATTPVKIARTSTGAVDACATLLSVSRACDCSCALTRQYVAVGHN